MRRACAESRPETECATKQTYKTVVSGVNARQLTRRLRRTSAECLWRRSLELWTERVFELGRVYDLRIAPHSVVVWPGAADLMSSRGGRQRRGHRHRHRSGSRADYSGGDDASGNGERGGASNVEYAGSDGHANVEASLGQSGESGGSGARHSFHPTTHHARTCATRWN